MTSLPAPAEHCGDMIDSPDGIGWIECVLRPGHHGSHADHRDNRWAEKPRPAVAPDLRAALAAAVKGVIRDGAYWLPTDGQAAIVDAVHAAVEQAVDTERRAALPFIDRIGNAREWARRNLTIDQQDGLFRVLRGDTPTLDRPEPRTVEPQPAADEFEQLRQRAEEAEAALAALHEGEEQPPYMNTNTPGEWIWRWNRATPEHRQALAARVLNRGNQSALKRAHAALAEQAGKDQAALARVRAFLDRDQVGLCCSRLIGQLRYLVSQSCCCDHGADRHDGDGECQICNCPHTEEPRP